MKLYNENADLIFQNSYHDPLLSYLTEIIDTIVGYRHSQIILDLGCGTGRTTVALAKKRHYIFAVDKNKQALSIAKKWTEKEGYSANVTFLLADARKKLPWKKKFDICIISEVIEHIDDPTGIIELAYMSLKPGGTLILTTPHGLSQWSILDEYAQHKHRYSIDEIRILLRKFQVTQIYTVGFPLFRTFLYLYNMLSVTVKLKHDNMEKLRKFTMLNTVYFLIGRLFLSFDRLFNFTHRGTTVIAVAKKLPQEN